MKSNPEIAKIFGIVVEKPDFFENEARQKAKSREKDVSGGSDLSDELVQRSVDFQQSISGAAGTAQEVAYWVLIALGVLATYVGYRSIKALWESFKESQEYEEEKARRSKGRI